jgi:YggT family protein
LVANAGNALLFLLTTVADLMLGVVLLRVLLQGARADFYNPISQLVWRLTQPVVRPLQAVVPRWRRVDLAGILLLYLLSFLFVQLVINFLGVGSVGIPAALWFALLKIITLTLNLYTLSLFAQAILSWVGPGVTNPAANVLWSLNEPLLRPVRRILPPLAGLDLTPIPVMLALQVLDRLLELPAIFR